MKKETLEKKTCVECNHLDEDPGNIPFYFCNIHRREIFDPTKAGCYHRDRITPTGINIRDYVGGWFEKEKIYPPKPNLPYED